MFGSAGPVRAFMPGAWMVHHHIPLFITLGAAEREDEPGETAIKDYRPACSKRSFQVS